MQIEVNGKIYEVEVTYKNNKNMYLRVKSDLKVHICAPKYIKDKEIKKFVSDNMEQISKYLREIENKNIYLSDKLFYLGNDYEINYINTKDIIFGANKVFMGKNFNLDNWYKKEAYKIYKERLDYCYNKFEENIPYPELKIRKMTSKWGVCNITKKTITLNLELIKLSPLYLDYVIIHELSHLVYANHSNSFWKEVEKYCPNYKKYRKEMKSLI